MYQNRPIRTALYMLKRQYGGSLTVYKQTGSAVDYETGQLSVTAIAYPIRLAVILPTVWRRVRKSTVSKDTQGPVGSRDVGLKSFIIDRADINGISLTPSDWLVYAGWKYQIEEIDASEFDAGWLVTARLVSGSESDTATVVTTTASVTPAAGADVE